MITQPEPVRETGPGSPTVDASCEPSDPEVIHPREAAVVAVGPCHRQ